MRYSSADASVSNGSVVSGWASAMTGPTFGGTFQSSSFQRADSKRAHLSTPI